ncbi:MAG: hydrogenase maturation protease, partial [Archaeoglobaceae archaeon]
MKIAVIGIGNILLGDEGVGVRIVEELRKSDLPENVEVHDGATSGIALLNFLVDKDKVIIVDAVKGGEEPGTVYQFS